MNVLFNEHWIITGYVRNEYETNVRNLSII